MGTGIAERLLEAKHEVHGWNRTREKAERLAPRGVVVAESPRAVAEACELTITMVSDNAALRAVCEGENGILAGLGAGKILAEMSTTAPALVRELAERVRERGGALLDAPVSGSILTLRQGKALIMVGGEERACESAEPILLAIGSTVKRVGDAGQAKAMKIGLNVSLAVQILGLLGGAPTARATERLTLDDVVRRALSFAPSVASAAAASDLGRATLGEARAPLYRLRSALSRLWLTYPQSSFLENPG